MHLKTVNLCAISLLALGAVSAGAQSGMTSSSSSAPSDMAAAPDNTKSNKLDPSNRTVSADKQGQGSADVKMTQEIRRSIMADKSLSTYAHNVKIVTVDGAVTLNGVVNSDEEKATIKSKATKVAGAGKVTDEMKVKEAH
ncbi:MAG: BON domain-containing protein [Pseudomonadota bacterium]|nr:BON domain-containing protein [Pseudomonadota bacterium]